MFAFLQTGGLGVAGSNPVAPTTYKINYLASVLGGEKASAPAQSPTLIGAKTVYWEELAVFVLLALLFMLVQMSRWFGWFGYPSIW